MCVQYVLHFFWIHVFLMKLDSLLMTFDMWLMFFFPTSYTSCALLGLDNGVLLFTRIPLVLILVLLLVCLFCFLHPTSSSKEGKTFRLDGVNDSERNCRGKEIAS